MRKTAFAVVSLVVLFSTVVASQLCSSANANPNWRPWMVKVDQIPGTIPPKITILSPKNHTTYSSSKLNLTVILIEPEPPSPCKIEYFWTYCLLDGRHVPFDVDVDSGNVDMDLLVSNGDHELFIYAQYTVEPTSMTYFLMASNSTVFFTVDASPPVISGLSVENKTYNEFDLPLNLTVDEPASWIGYSLDNEANVTLSGISTLTLNEGSHSIVVYANDTVGNMGASETIYFTIENPFPTSLVMASSATVAAVLVGLGLLVYFKKIKR